LKRTFMWFSGTISSSLYALVIAKLWP